MNHSPTESLGAEHPLGPYLARLGERALDMDELTCGCQRISRKTRTRLVYVLDTLACRDLAPADAVRSMRITPKVLHRLVMVLRYRFMVPIRYSSSKRAYVRLRQEHRDAALLLAGRIISDDRRYTRYHFHDATEYFTL